MQQFTVPQFIDVEDKIIGPITVRQFIIILAGCMLVAIFYKLFDFSAFLVLSIITLAIIIVFAFIRINGRPFHFFILNVAQTVKKPGVRVWNHILAKADMQFKEEKETAEVISDLLPAPAKSYTASRLTELSLIVDTRGAYQGEEDNGSAKIKNY